jgi:inner membrane protein
MTSQNPAQWIRTSQFTRILLVGFLILMLQIPILFLESLVSDRESLYNVAVTDITSTRGQPQTIIGPQLVIPYVKRSGSGNNLRSEVKYGVFLPDELTITGKIATEVLHRGLFQVPVYSASLQINGQFQRPNLEFLKVKPEDIRWEDAELSLQIADTQSIKNQAVLTWNKTDIPLESGAGILNSSQPSIYASLRKQMIGDQFTFSLPLELNGSERISFSPFGKVTQVSLSSDWSDPSFQGAWLPVDRSVTPQGFTASWSIPSLGRGFPQQWNSDAPVADSLFTSALFGVDFIAPVDNYRMVRRSIKYNFLFLVLTFAVFWLFEVIVRLRVHPLQYLLVGTAMCLFYLLQLAFSEHLGFQTAYIIATIAVVGLITSYSIAVLKANQRGGTIGLTQVCLYSYLYIVLAHQDYALLIGSIGLFSFLAVVMYLTREIDWFETGHNRPEEMGQ